MLREYNIENKIIAIILENTSSNNVVTELLKPALQLDLNEAIFHNRCASHIINIIVQVGVKYIRDVLETIKWIVGFIFLFSLVKTIVEGYMCKFGSMTQENITRCKA